MFLLSKEGGGDKEQGMSEYMCAEGVRWGVEPGSGPRTRFTGKNLETGKVTSSKARRQHFSVWREGRGGERL